jgi:hypothetical protein
MLFTDADFVTWADMLAIDPEISRVAKAESITIDTPAGIAAQACGEVGQKLISENQLYTGFAPPVAMPYTQTAAVLNMVGPSVNRSRVSLSQIVVSSANPTDSSLSQASVVKRYAIYHALYLFYRAAFFKKANDRFDNKRKEYREEMRRYVWPRLFNTGCPVVYNPLACPGAIHEYNAGSWGSANVHGVSGTNPDATANYDVAITWVDNTKYLSPTQKANAESSTSALVTVVVPSAHVIRASIAGLNPPNGQNPVNVALGQGLLIPGKASGWNLYVGLQGQTMFLQNSSPIPIATLTYTLSGPPTLCGYAADLGQWPDAYWTMQKMLMRG